MERDIDDEYMALALRLAERGRGTTRPNPVVGAVLARDGVVLSTGFHRRAGEDHAEVSALRKADARVAHLYVTLEPCCHEGRTGPCTEAIIAAGVRRVVVGTLDPNPLVSGKGVARLREAGLAVDVGVLEERCRRANAHFFKYITTGRPFVTLKLAQTLDGRIATSTGASRYVTGKEALRQGHRLRASHDAVLVGRGTLANDDPQLTVRRVRKRGSGPVRIVLDSELRSVRPESAVFGKDGGPVVVATALPEDNALTPALGAAGAAVVTLPRSDDGLDLGALMVRLGKDGITSVLVEGGGRVAASLLRRGLVDRIVVFVAPLLVGGDGVAAVATMGVRALSDAVRLSDVRVRKLGADLMIDGVPVRTGEA